MLNTTYLSHRALRAVSQRLPVEFAGECHWSLPVGGNQWIETITSFLFPSIPYQRSLPETDLLEEV